MMKHDDIRHKFVRHIPDHLEPGILYISMEYATAAHSCCCGCGEEVVTPFTPTDWQMTFNGETISLHPSVGNWNLACRSHYVIKHGRVIQAGFWSDEQIKAERLRDKEAKARYYGTSVKAMATNADQSVARPVRSGPKVWAQFMRWVRGLLG
jgi:hypothetical protein